MDFVGMFGADFDLSEAGCLLVAGKGHRIYFCSKVKQW